ncbi:MAG: type II CAAX endopeptidase family protein [Bacilli bacterium]|jgi:membrane protease YdiL (CAAX protease family)|nr:type II CAAX endopeptidase family protein [Bacilli bacterium]MDD3388719.1 type II CAAX endopeptidase family protein [Bacilli bacterium]MDD4344509.1 type II CAAX endopeptidase family protein [Bacilli bacterium]MDD4520403.1 type II CAAX endopeptidase family protein [Bacilli bacterium]MDY0399182.1 type II CAAX endopeptidase family protein [Bacilli bacterium]
MNNKLLPDAQSTELKSSEENLNDVQPSLTFSSEKHLILFALGFLGVNFFSFFVVLFFRLILGHIPGQINPGFLQTDDFLGLTNGLIYFVIIVTMMIPLSDHIPNIIATFKHKKVWINGLGYTALIIIISGIYSFILNITGLTVSDNANQSAITALVLNSPIDSFIWIVLLGPIVEELTYRLGLFSMIKRKNRIFAYIAVMLLFGLIHFDFTNPNLLNEFLNLPSYIIGGAVLCFAYDREGLATSITAHIFNNLLSFIMIFLGALFL